MTNVELSSRHNCGESLFEAPWLGSKINWRPESAMNQEGLEFHFLSFPYPWGSGDESPFDQSSQPHKWPCHHSADRWPQDGLWAVGAGSRKRARIRAAKVALAVAAKLDEGFCVFAEIGEHRIHRIHYFQMRIQQFRFHASQILILSSNINYTIPDCFCLYFSFVWSILCAGPFIMDTRSYVIGHGY